MSLAPRERSIFAGFISELDGLRGLAISMVLLHRFWPREGELAAYGALPGAGWVGVDLFFVISGFLIAGILLDTRDDPGSLRNFYARRVLRIFPLYYLFVGSILIVLPLLQGGPYGETAFIEASGSPAWYLLFLGNIPEGVLGLDPPYWLAPVWSLAIEEQFYLTFPWLVRALDRRRLTQVLIGLIVLAPVVRLVTMVAGVGNERFQYMFTLCRVDAIAAGCLLAIIVRHPRVVALRRPAAALLAVAVIVVAAVAAGGGLDRTTPFGRVLGYSAIALAFAAVVLAVVLHRDHRSTAALRFAPLRYLGKLCFGLYLLHRPADTLVTALAVRAGLDPNTTLVLLAKVVAAITLATLSWYAFERPILALKRHFTSRRHPASRTGSSVVPRIGTIALVAIMLGAAGCDRRSAGSPDAVSSPDGPPACPPQCGSVDAMIADAMMIDALNADAPVDGNGPPDATVDAFSSPDATPLPPAIILYPEDRRHSPITPEIATRLQAIVQGGTDLPRVFAKVGDSITETPSFLYCYEDGPVDLAGHDELAGTLAYFLAGNAGGTTPFDRDSGAAVGGWASSEALAGSPSPLDQEIDAIRPRYAVVMFGTNDIGFRTPDAFGSDMLTIVDNLCAQNVIPILSTIPPIDDDPGDDVRVPLFNRVIRAVAQGRQIPLIDFHRELVALPDHGLSSDGVHPSVAPAGACVLTPSALAYGYNIRNLISLEALDRARRTVNGVTLDATAPVRTGTGLHADPVIGDVPFVDLADTQDGEAVLAGYSGCGVNGQTGRELVYRVDLAAAMTLDVHVIDRGTVDVDVHLLAGSLSGASCVATGTASVSATVGPGTVYIVVDSAAASEGEFMLVVQPG